MKDSVAFVGDVHGNFAALTAVLEEVRARAIATAVLLGDYINKGWDSKRVLNVLVDGFPGVTLIALRGNHEDVLLKCLDDGDVRPLLRMSGAPTIRSYVGDSVGPDVFSDFSSAFPLRHRQFLAGLSDVYVEPELVASHAPRTGDSRFHVSAHVPVGLAPRITPSSAEIDTGCGSHGGRLTAFIWPARTYFQVDDSGAVLSPSTA